MNNETNFKLPWKYVLIIRIMTKIIDKKRTVIKPFLLVIN